MKSGEHKLGSAKSIDVLGRRNRNPRLTIRVQWLPYYRRLLQIREHLLSESGRLRESAASEIPVEQMHPAESASDEFDHNLALSLLSAEQDALYEVDEALRRIQSETYGYCELTGKPISAERLQVVPWTRFSVDARKQLESDRVTSRPHLEPAGSVRGVGASVETEEQASDEELTIEQITPG